VVTRTPSARISAAREADVPLILEMIRELADFERMAHEVTATETDLRQSLFGAERAAEAIVAWEGTEARGFALFFHNFSTFLGRRGLYLEDLYVRPTARGRGIGRLLLARLASIAAERGCGRMEWSVLDWNQGAIRFYRGLDARPMDEWTVFRLAGDGLERLAAEGGGSAPG
jgi:GNAT superfamily N-acetyltransferase